MGERKIQDWDYVVVDTETTGGSSTFHRIIEVAAVHYRDGIIYSHFSTLINPRKKIPPWITILTGIDDDMVKSAPPFEEIADDLKKFLNKGVFVAHNVPFDYRFIQNEYKRLDQDFDISSLCTLKLARKIYSDLKSRSLGALCDELMINIESRHRAYGDAEATVYLLKEMLRVLESNHGITTHDQLLTYLSSKLKVQKANRPE